jgi:hypothetical protein
MNNNLWKNDAVVGHGRATREADLNVKFDEEQVAQNAPRKPIDM